MVLEVNPDAKRISLSIRATLPQEEREEIDPEPYQQQQQRPREDHQPRERSASAYERASQARQGGNAGGQRRERQQRNDGPTSYSEDSSVTLGDLMPSLRDLFGSSEEPKEVPATPKEPELVEAEVEEQAEGDMVEAAENSPEGE